MEKEKENENNEIKNLEKKLDEKMIVLIYFEAVIDLQEGMLIGVYYYY